MSSFQSRDGSSDAVHIKLKRTVEKQQSSYLWIPEHQVIFVPRLLPTIYGDGRALFRIATINQRPAYWLIRACSTWGSGMDRKESPGPDFAEMTDQVMEDLENAFGRGRCGYSGNSLFYPKKERVLNCQCEDCADRFVARWPMVDDDGGCLWGRIDWPKNFKAVANPLSWQGNLLAIPATAALTHSISPHDRSGA